jgi:hypothetical protein
MSDGKRSPAEVLRHRILDAIREAGALLAAGDRGTQTQAYVERARASATELKALSQRMGSAEGYDDAVRMLTTIEALQAKLRPADPKQ